jgi:hypothetical protein
MTFNPRIIGEDEATQAWDWGANCGPFALAAISGLSMSEIRPALEAVRFDERRYTSPAMMYGALTRLGVPWFKNGVEMPTWGLARVQWEGPWTQAGRPMRERYRHTHWIGLAKLDDHFGAFDVNCLGNGSGWVSWEEWQSHVVPWIVEKLVPGGDGRWHFTRTIEIER